MFINIAPADGFAYPRDGGLRPRKRSFAIVNFNKRGTLSDPPYFTRFILQSPQDTVAMQKQSRAEAFYSLLFS